MSLQSKMLNEICRLLYRKEFRRFVSDCDVKKVQEEYLMNLLRKNADTKYGRQYHFAGIKSYEEYAGMVPITVYEDYEPYIQSIMDGEDKVLTTEPVLLFELTSGSSGGKKLIPYTNALKQEFQKGIKPWLCDLYTGLQGMKNGKSYWSITPVTSKKEYTKCGIPMGFEEDAEYFGAVEQSIMRRIFAVDSSVKFSDSMETFYLKTGQKLLQCEELTLISVWNPTFLSILCDYMREHVQQVTADLDAKRRQTVIVAIEENRFDKVFPMLKLISCWADGSAEGYIADIKERFPGILIQPKGLLATECFVSFPLLGEAGSRLSIYSHFFEFRSLTDDTIVLASGLKKGEYEVIVTTGGGFYRYSMGDIIEVLEVYENRPPRIRFLKRGGVTSDLFGEKLTEEFVRNACKKIGISESFCLLSPVGKSYCMFTTAENVTDDILDEVLRENYHYNYCRQLGQLDKAKVCRVYGEPKDAYIRRLVADGMRIGDIKPAYLSPKKNWQDWFQMRKEK